MWMTLVIVINFHCSLCYSQFWLQFVAGQLQNPNPLCTKQKTYTVSDEQVKICSRSYVSSLEQLLESCRNSNRAKSKWSNKD